MKSITMKRKSREIPTVRQSVEIGASSEEIREQIALAAYYKAERRGFAPGFELQDWLDSEREVATEAGLGAARH